MMLARGRVSAWLTRRGPWTLVITVGSMAMTLYLWHLTAMVALYGLVLHVDPLQNLVHLMAGSYLTRAARAGLTDRPFPWLLTAAGSALPLAMPTTGPVTIVLHATVVVLALTIAATRRHPNRSGSRSRAHLRDGA